MIKCRCWTFYLQYFSVPLNHELKLESNNTAMQRQQPPRKLLKCSSAGNDIFHHVFQTTQWLWNGVRILQTDTKIHVLCFVEINCVLLNLLCVWILWNASSHFCFRSLCVTLEQNLNLIRWQKTMPSIIIVFLSLSLYPSVSMLLWPRNRLKQSHCCMLHWVQWEWRRWRRVPNNSTTLFPSFETITVLTWIRPPITGPLLGFANEERYQLTLAVKLVLPQHRCWSLSQSDSYSWKYLLLQSAYYAELQILHFQRYPQMWILQGHYFLQYTEPWGQLCSEKINFPSTKLVFCCCRTVSFHNFYFYILTVFLCPLSACGKFGTPHPGMAKQLQEQCYPFLSVCVIFLCVQTIVWLAGGAIKVMLTQSDKMNICWDL